MSVHIVLVIELSVQANCIVFSQRLQKLNGCCFSVNCCGENNYVTDILLDKIVLYLKVNVKMVLRHLEQNIRPR